MTIHLHRPTGVDFASYRARRLLPVVLLILMGGHCWPQSRNQPITVPPKLSTKQIVKRASDALVLITIRNLDGQEIAIGSGFFFDKSLVATNLHVLRWASRASAKMLANGVEYPINEVLRFDLKNDICVLLVDAAEAKPLPLGNSEKAAVGDDIIVAGNPEGLEGTFSKGIISGLRHVPDRLQIDAAISPGSSGGPVLNMRGEVVGIASSTVASGQNLNFAVPINLLPVVVELSESEVEEAQPISRKNSSTQRGTGDIFDQAEKSGSSSPPPASLKE